MALVDAQEVPLSDVSAKWTLFAAADQLNCGAACIFDTEDSVAASSKIHSSSRQPCQTKVCVLSGYGIRGGWIRLSEWTQQMNASLFYYCD